MLKIYNVYPLHGNIVLKDYIIFTHGRFDTGLGGYGNVTCDSKSITYKKVNYEYVDINNYVELSKENAKIEDGFIKNFQIYNPLTYEEIEKKFKDIPPTEEDYEKYNLNEDGILLFTDCIYIKYKSDELIQKIFGRYSGTGLYLVKPGATFTMSTMLSNCNEETYEALQSKKIGKQLVLAKLNRSIK